MGMSKENKAAPGGERDGVLSCIARNRKGVAAVVLIQLGARLLAVGLAAVLMRGNGPAPGGIPWQIGLAVAAAVWVLLVLPLRCQGGEKLRRMFYSRARSGDAGIPYGTWLRTEISRCVRGLMWGLPFFAVIGAAAYSGYQLYAAPINKGERLQSVQNLAAWVGREPALDTGLAVALGAAAILLLVTGLLFAYGWWRNMPVEYLPSRAIGAGKTFRWARRMRRHHRARFVGTTAVNALMCLPAMAGAVAVLYHYGQTLADYLRQNLSGGDSIGMMQIRAALSRLPVPGRTHLLALTGVFLALYLPFCLIRKMRNARLVARLIRSSEERHRRHHSSASGTSAGEPEAGEPVIPGGTASKEWAAYADAAAAEAMPAREERPERS